jgi:hypothetical protein
MAGLFDLGTIDKLESIRNKQRQEDDVNTSNSKSNFSLFHFVVVYWKRTVMTRTAFRLF